MRRIRSWVIVTLMTVSAGALVRPAQGASKVEVFGSSISVEDLATALGVQWWSYTVKAQEPLSNVKVQLCEFRRQPDGRWRRSAILMRFEEGFGAELPRQLSVMLFIPAKSNENDYSLHVGSTVSRGKFEKTPDFSRTHTLKTLQEVKFLAGCLPLAIEENDAHRVTNREENMVRVIGLEVETR